jgi:hypothetical protein
MNSDCSRSSAHPKPHHFVAVRAWTISVALALGFVTSLTLSFVSSLLWNPLSRTLVGEQPAPDFVAGSSSDKLVFTRTWGMGITYEEWFDNETGGRIIDVEEFRAGWPMRAFLWRSVMLSGAEDSTGRLFLPAAISPKGRGYRTELATGSNTRERVVVPALPIWRGLAINTGLFALVFWGVYYFPRRAKQLARHRRGQCSRCGYYLGELAMCPECGTRVDVRN